MNYPPDMLPTAIKMLGALVIVLAGLLSVLYVIKKISKGGLATHAGKNITVIEMSSLGDKNKIALVEIPGQVMVLGVSSDQISLLSKIEDMETIKNIKTPDNQNTGSLFFEQLQKFTSRIKTDGKDS